MALISRCFLTIEDPIPEWKGTEALPEVLTISGSPPPISGAPDDIPFHCAETFARDNGIQNTSSDPEVVVYELVENTKYDDQS